MDLPDRAAVLAARSRIAPHVLRTPVLRSEVLNNRFGTELFFKCENLQPMGAFKIRGAVNAVLHLDDASAARGVATHSSGNHGAALAWAARLRTIPATVVMPHTAPASKQANVRFWGARIIPCEPTLEAREQTLAAELARSGATPIHPYDNALVIAGQGTAALELQEDVATPLDEVLVPIGGGGLAAGTALALADRSTRVVACEPAGADDAARSLAAGRIIPMVNPVTIADGLRTSLGQRNFALLTRYLDAITTVPEDAISEAMQLLWNHLRVVVEASAAVPLGAIVSGAHQPSGDAIGVILSGGNVDLGRLPWQGAGP